MNSQSRRTAHKQPEHGPHAALRDFIQSAQELNPYEVAWTDSIWPTASSEDRTRAHLANSKLALVFAVHPRTFQNSREQRLPFEQTFADLIKAIIVKRRVDTNVGTCPQRVLLRAARYLYDALPLPAVRDTTLITRGHFASAETACLRRESPNSAYRVGTLLEAIAKLLDRMKLTRAPIDYRSSIRRLPHGDRTSDDFTTRVGRLPSNEALDALAVLANDETMLADESDRLFMRLTELLFIGGFRIGELLTLPANALVEEVDVSKGTLDRPLQRIGLRYWPEKGGEPVVKWVPAIANDLVRRAIHEVN